MNSNDRIEHIDVWRCLAIGLVIFSHIVTFSHPWYKETFPGLAWRVEPLGKLGVELFFCISGFVISRGMLKESMKSGTVNMRSFYIRRAFRILPPLLFYIAVLALLALAGLVELEARQVASAIGFVCNVGDFNCGWLLGHTWSLAFEEQFYIVFPMLFLVFGFAAYRNKLATMALAMLLTTAIAQLTGYDTIGYYVSTFAYMVWGCVFALYWDKLKSLLANIPFPIWLLSAAVLPGVHFVAVPEVFHRFIYPVLAPLVICIVIFGTPAQHFIVRRLFTNTRLAYLGRISYSIYLWQQLATGDFGLSSPTVAPLLVPCVILVAHLSFRYFETRMIAIGAALSTRSFKLLPLTFDDPLTRNEDTSWRP